MRDFIELIQATFYSQTRWNNDNDYALLTATASNLLDFDIPHGIRLHLASLASPNFATSYALSSSGLVNGNLAFLYSSRPLHMPYSGNSHLRLAQSMPGYRHLREFTAPSVEPNLAKDALLYGRLYLPGNTLEALYLKRLSPFQLLRVSCVSSNALPNGGTILAQLNSDYGKYSTECLFSSDASLIGLRGLYNFGFDPRHPDRMPARSLPAHPWDHRGGRLSAGLEAYFSPQNKSGGLSTGLRFTTLPSHLGFPYTMTLTVNPLMGNLSTTYAVKAGKHLSLCSQFDFNVYSYESDVAIGLELWQLQKPSKETSWAKKLLRPEWNDPDDIDGVLKARMDNSGRLRLLWEWSVKELLVSLGAGFDLSNKANILGGIGLQVSYSS